MTLQDHRQTVDATSQTRTGLIAVVAIVVVSLLALGGWFLVNRGDDVQPQPGDQKAEPAEFDFAIDSMCHWITAEDMNAIVADAQQRAGTNWRFAAFEAADCAPYPTGLLLGSPTSEWSPMVWATSRSQPNSLPGLSVGLVPVARVPEEYLPAEPEGDFAAHDMLAPSVTYSGLSYSSDWGQEKLSVALRVEGHEGEVLWLTVRHSSNPEGQGLVGESAWKAFEESQVALGFAVADGLLRGMNWVE